MLADRSRTVLSDQFQLPHQVIMELSDVVRQDADHPLLDTAKLNPRRRDFRRYSRSVVRDGVSNDTSGVHDFGHQVSVSCRPQVLLHVRPKLDVIAALGAETAANDPTKFK